VLSRLPSLRSALRGLDSARLAAGFMPAAWPGWGFGSWAPPGGQRERWRRPQPAQAARGLRLEREDGDGAGWAGARSEAGRRAQPVEGDAGACNASTATHHTRSAPQHSPP
jgi:hypothetical protein